MSNINIYCIVDVFVKPESVDKVRDVLLKIVDDSRKEYGCLKYKLFENMNDKFQFTFMEVWENEDAFEDHLQSDHILKASMNVKDDLTKITDIKCYKCIKFNQKQMNNEKTSKFCILI